jgi:hypothetical protein
MIPTALRLFTLQQIEQKCRLVVDFPLFARGNPVQQFFVVSHDVHSFQL